jgi:glutamate racemase
MKVGVFDSGLGGLTVVYSMLKHLCGVEIYYLADTKNAPYGDKSKKQILDFSIAITQHFIDSFEIDALVIACNTATSASIKELREIYPNLIIIGTEPAIKPAFKVSKSKKVGILATKATLSGEKYQSLVQNLSDEYDIEVFEQACVGLVQEIEKGNINTSKTKEMLKGWLTPMREANVDAIVLGCTHYPLVGEVIKEVMEHDIELLESSDAISKRVLTLLEAKGHVNSEENFLKVSSTGDIEASMVELILGEKYDIERVGL